MLDTNIYIFGTRYVWRHPLISASNSCWKSTLFGAIQRTAPKQIWVPENRSTTSCVPGTDLTYFDFMKHVSQKQTPKSASQGGCDPKTWSWMTAGKNVCPRALILTHTCTAATSFSLRIWTKRSCKGAIVSDTTSSASSRKTSSARPAKITLACKVRYCWCSYNRKSVILDFSCWILGYTRTSNIGVI